MKIILGEAEREEIHRIIGGVSKENADFYVLKETKWKDWAWFATAEAIIHNKSYMSYVKELNPDSPNSPDDLFFTAYYLTEGKDYLYVHKN